MKLLGLGLLLVGFTSCGYFGITPNFKVGDCVAGGLIANFSYKIIDINNNRYIVKNEIYVTSLEYGYLNRNYAKVNCSEVE